MRKNTFHYSDISLVFLYDFANPALPGNRRGGLSARADGGNSMFRGGFSMPKRPARAGGEEKKADAKTHGAPKRHDVPQQRVRSTQPQQQPPQADAPQQRLSSFTRGEAQAAFGAPPAPAKPTGAARTAVRGSAAATQRMPSSGGNLSAARASAPSGAQKKRRATQESAPVRSVKASDGRTKVSTPMKKQQSPKNRRPTPGQTAKIVVFNLLKAAFVTLCACLVVAAIVMVNVTSYVLKTMENDDVMLNLESQSMPQVGYILARDPATGEWIEYQKNTSGSINNIWVSYEQIPQALKDAAVSTEDREFFEHGGFNLRRTIGAAANEFLMFQDQFGASTIDQQLVKNLTKDDVVSEDGDRTAGYERKIREIFRAVGLNNRYSKEQILEAYLNTMGLSGNIVGVQAAAHEYFYKDVSELSIAECALIVGITKAPGAYNPYLHPEAAMKRRDDVLTFMRDNAKITEEQYQEALVQPLGLYEGARQEDESTTDSGATSYFTDAVFEQVVHDLVEQGIMPNREAAINYYYTGGLRIEATIDLKLQAEMEKLYELGYGEGGAFPATEFLPAGSTDANGNVVTSDTYAQSAMAVVRYDGSLAGVVGGIGEKEVSLGLNRATQSPRPVGSTMKPVAAYPMALDNGLINYGSLIPDSYVLSNPDWPVNYGPTAPTNNLVPVYYAIANSMNTVAAWVGNVVGVEEMYDFAANTLEISTLVNEGDVNDHGLSPLVLGGMTKGISAAELANAYTMYGGESTYGGFTSLHTYERVLDANGNIVMLADKTQSQAISPQTGYIMNRLLSNVLRIQGGTANGMALETTDSVGKTGTTSDNKDRWFVGLTPNYVTACWWGYDSNDVLKLPAGTTTNPPTIAWKMLMDTIQADMEPKEFPPRPDGVEELAFCRDSGLLAGEKCTNRMTGFYNTEYKPDVCTIHDTAVADPAAADAAAAAVPQDQIQNG